MNLKQKLFYAIAGFLIGNLILASIIFGISHLSKNQLSINEITFDVALRRIDAKEIKEVIVKDDKAIFLDEFKGKYSKNPSVEQIRILTEKASTKDFKVTFEPNFSNQNSSNPLDKLFQILFMLFIISPPIIVVLLLIIIKKMKSNDSIK